MEKLNYTFEYGHPVPSIVLNRMTAKIDELVENANELDPLKDREVNIPQDEFDDMFTAGTLDPTKDYYTYEE